MLLRLLHRYSSTQIKGRLFKVLLTVLGVALGIGLFLATREANVAAYDELDQSVHSLEKFSPLQLRSTSGKIPESVLMELEGAEGVETLSGRLEALGRISGSNGERRVRVYGVDILKAARSGYWGDVEIPREDFTDLLRYSAGITSTQFAQSLDGPYKLFTGRSSAALTLLPMPPGGLLESFGEDVIILDISFFQELFQTFGVVHAIDLATTDLFQEERFRRELPPYLKLVDRSTRSGIIERASSAFRMNLKFLSAISLFVAAFLIYNTVSFLALQRRADFSLLVSLGVKPRTITALLLTEGAILGALGGVVGIGIGQLLFVYTNEAVRSTISNLYAPVSDAALSTVSAEGVVLALLLSALCGAAASIGPAFSLLRYRPREVRVVEQAESRFRRHLRWFPGAAAVSLCGAAAAGTPWFLSLGEEFAFVAPILLTTAFLLICPLVVRWIGKSRFQGASLLLAVEQLRSSLGRSSVAVAAIALALGLFLGMATMVTSFRTTLAEWLTSVASADLFISSASQVAGGSLLAPIPLDAVQQVTTTPGIAAANLSRTQLYLWKENEVLVRGENLPLRLSRDTITFLSELEQDQWPNDVDEYLFISEPLSLKYGLTPGEVVNLPFPADSRTFTVLGVYQDFGSDRGTFLMNLPVLNKLTGSEEVHTISLHLDGTVDRGVLRERLGGEDLQIRDQHELREQVLSIFDRTFEITYAMELVCIIISLFVLTNSLMMIFVERRRYFAVLEAIGASSKVLRRTLAVFATLVGGAAVIVGTLLGLALALMLVFSINRYFFGWSVSFHFPFLLVTVTGLGFLLLALAAGSAAGFFLLRNSTTGALRHD